MSDELAVVWNTFDPNDLNSYPTEGRMIEMLFSNGRSFDGRFAYVESEAFFCHMYLIPEGTERLEKLWRYIE